MPTALELLTRLADTPPGTEQDSFTFQHPVLLSPHVQQTLTQELQKLVPKEQGRLTPALKYLQGLRRTLEESERSYPIGEGPLERIWQRQVNGEISMEYALTLARDPQVAGLLAPIYVCCIAAYSLSFYDEHEDWRQMLRLMELVLAAVEVFPESEDAKLMRKHLALDWVQLVHIIVVDLPDGPLFKRAVAIGQRALDEARTSHDQNFLSILLYRLGMLYLDPYAVNLESLSYERRVYEFGLRAWIKRLDDELGQHWITLSEKGEVEPDQVTHWKRLMFDLLDGKVVTPPQEELWMPLPLEALKTAEQYLRQAVQLSAGHQKGLALTALIQALEWQSFFQQPIDRKEVLALCQQALQFLEPEHAPKEWLSILLALIRNDAVIPAKELQRLLEHSLDEFLRLLGPSGTIDLVRHAQAVFLEIDPPSCLALLRQARWLIKDYGTEHIRMQLLLNELITLGKVYTPEASELLASRDLQAAVAQLRMWSQAEHWDIQKLSIGLIGLALKSQQSNEEKAGLALLQEVLEQAPVLTHEYAEALTYLQGILFQGWGVNAVESKDFLNAVQAYCNALELLLNLQLPEVCLALLNYIDDLAALPDPTLAALIGTRLSPLAITLEQTLGDSATPTLLHICKNAIRVLSTQRKVDINLLLLFWQIAKGLRMTVALYAGSPQSRQETDEGKSVLAQISELEAALFSRTSGIPPHSDNYLVHVQAACCVRGSTCSQPK